jgi:hypothetical protein
VLQQPTEFGHYVLVEEVGVGGMARVYKAVRAGPMGFRKEVAIKQILPQAAKDKKQIKALINEARLGGFLHHRNIVEVFEFDQVDDLYYIAMEFVDGYNLEQILRRIPLQGTIPPRIALAIAIQLCQGLAYAHSAQDDSGRAMNLVHRDLKPGNVMVDQRGVVKIMDFGVARAETNLFTTQTVGMTKGTPAYMSPEQTTGEKLDPIDRRSDLFSAGSLIAEVITGEVSFHATKLYEVLRKIADGETAPVLDRVRERLPPMEPVLQRALQLRPADRFTNAEEMGAAIQAVYEQLPGDAELGPWLAEWMGGAGPDVSPLARSELEVVQLPGAPELSLDEEDDASDARPPGRGFRWGLAAGLVVLLLLAAAIAGGVGTLALVRALQVDYPVTTAVGEGEIIEVAPTPATVERVEEVTPAVGEEPETGAEEAGDDAVAGEDSTTESLPAHAEVRATEPEPATPEPLPPQSVDPDLPSAAQVVTPATVEFIVGSNASVRDCFAQERSAGATLPGRIWVRFTVAPSGSVSGARLITDGFAGTSLEACVSSRIDGLEFPPFAGPESKTAKYAFVAQ